MRETVDIVCHEGLTQTVEVLQRHGVWVIHRTHDSLADPGPVVITHAPSGRMAVTVFSFRAALAAIGHLAPEWRPDLAPSHSSEPLKIAPPPGWDGAIRQLRDDGVVYVRHGESLDAALYRAGIVIDDVEEP